MTPFDEKSLGHGLTGGLLNAAEQKLEHGSFRDGFLSGFVSGLASIGIDKVGVGQGQLGIAERTALSAAVGGTAAELGGGKFANGAITAAFLRLYNDEIAPKLDRKVIELGKEQVDKAAGHLTGFNVYRMPDGTLVYQEMIEIRYLGQGRYQEIYPAPPEGGTFVVNGHTHPVNPDNPRAGASFSSDDIRMGDTLGPVMKNGIGNSYDIYYQGWRWLLQPNGRLGQPYRYP